MTEKKQKSYYNQTKNKRTQKFIHDNYKQLSIRLPLAGDITRDSIAAAAAAESMSINSYIILAIKEHMTRADADRPETDPTDADRPETDPTDADQPTPTD